MWQQRLSVLQAQAQARFDEKNAEAKQFRAENTRMNNQHAMLYENNEVVKRVLNGMQTTLDLRTIELAENSSTIDRLIQHNFDLQREIDEKNILLDGPDGLVQMSIDLAMTQVELPMPPIMLFSKKLSDSAGV
jgi:hypothetical protein